MMDAAQEARVAEIDAALKKRGADEVTGSDRRVLVDELTTLLTGPAQAPAALAPEKQARADQITARLRDHALGKPDAYLYPFERGRGTGRRGRTMIRIFGVLGRFKRRSAPSSFKAPLASPNWSRETIFANRMYFLGSFQIDLARSVWALSLALALLARPADAAVTGVIVGTGASQVLAAPTTRGYRVVILRNQSGSATISCAPGNASPAIGAAGSFDIAPGTSQSWAFPGVVFYAAWYCVASASSTPVTVEAE